MLSLSFIKSKELLLKYKIPVCQTELFISKDKAMAFAKRIGYPVVMKAYSPDILHRTDLGLVKLGIKNNENFEKSWEDISAIVKKRKLKIEGILVQKMVLGKEIVAGMKRNSQFGPVLMVGLGGIFVEVLKDVTFRIAPITEREAVAMLKETKGYGILKGIRGEKPVNIKAVAKIIYLVSLLSLKEKHIREIDFNPIIANEKTAVAVDFKFLV